MSPTVQKTRQRAGIVTDLRNGSSPATPLEEAVRSHKAADAALEALGKTLAAQHGFHPELELMREKLSRAASSVRVQLENRQAVAARLADVDVVLDMSEFVRQRILSQASLSRLSLPNDLAMHLVR